MPPPELQGLNTDVVVWPCVGRDDNDEPLIGQPYALKVRWVSTRRDSRSANGTSITLEADMVLDREVPEGSILWKGLIKNWKDDGTRTLYQLVSYGETDDIDGREKYRNGSVARFRNSLPSTM